MTNANVIQAFLRGDKATTTHLHSTGKLLVNYQTIVAKNNNGKITVTSSKYSKTTSAITNKLKAEAVRYDEADGDALNA